MYKFYKNYTQIIFLHGKYENKNCIKKRHDGYISSKCLTLTWFIPNMPLVYLIQYLRYFYYHWVDTSDGGV